MGRSKFLRGRVGEMDKEIVKQTTSSIIKAVGIFSQYKVGALIIIEMDVTLNDFAETGTKVDAAVSPELLENIFYEGAPLHDGAVIMRGNKVYAAACVLPLTRNPELPKELGTRHRAGIGITEVSDALAIIVSEETGVISVAKEGKLTRFIDTRTLEKMLLDIYLHIEPEKKKFSFARIAEKMYRKRSAAIEEVKDEVKDVPKQ
jgi:diadenylate cyclase